MSSRTAPWRAISRSDEAEAAGLADGGRQRRGRRPSGHGGLDDRLSERAQVDAHKTTAMAARIADVRATPVNIPLEAPYRFSYGSIASLTKTIVEVETDDGVVGLGEVASGDQSGRRRSPCASA